MTELSGQGERDGRAVSEFVERFASLLMQLGFPRMPARVFVALMATDSARLTAGELAGQLQVSPAAISGAVRYLDQIDLVSREREPGSRRDFYRVRDDVWYEMMVRRLQVMERWNTLLREGVEAVGAGSPAGERLTETIDFFDFLSKEMPIALAGWQARRRAERAD